MNRKSTFFSLANAKLPKVSMSCSTPNAILQSTRWSIYNSDNVSHLAKQPVQLFLYNCAVCQTTLVLCKQAPAFYEFNYILFPKDKP